MLKFYTIWFTTDWATISSRTGRGQATETHWVSQEKCIEQIQNSAKSCKNKFQIIVGYSTVNLGEGAREFRIRPYSKGFSIRTTNRWRYRFDSKDQLLLAFETKLAMFMAGNYRVFDE